MAAESSQEETDDGSERAVSYSYEAEIRCGITLGEPPRESDDE